METNIVTREDLNYLAQQSAGNLNMILSGMTALLNDTDNKVAMLESQSWFQRMCRTISGKNKMTQQEIQQNHDKINLYVSQAMTELFEQQCIDRQIMMSLGNQLNELYAEHLQLKQMLGAFVSKLNEKIESIDNFHMLNTEIEQGVYSSCSPIVGICKILAQMDKRCIQDYRKMNILQRSMASQGILNDTQTTLADYLMSIAQISVDDAGAIYIELSSIRGNFMANIILRMIENYHFLPDMARKLKNKQALVESVIANEQLEPSITLSIKDVYDDLVNSKLDMIEGLVPISAIQYDSKMQEAEKLYLEGKTDEAFELFKTLAEKGNNRAMYFMGEYYTHGYGHIAKDSAKAREWRIKGRDAGDILATLNVAYSLPNDSEERNTIFVNVFESVKNLAESGDIIAQNELADLYTLGHGCERNDAEGLRWLESSAEGGYWRSMAKLGDIYLNKENYSEAFKWYKKAANLNYGYAQGWTGNLLDWKGDLPKDYFEANEWYRKAAEQDVDFALYNLGYNYCDGKGCEIDYHKAFDLFKKSADLGYNFAQGQVGNLLDWKGNLPKDYYEANKWYQKAADQGVDWAMSNLAINYVSGKGCPVDYAKAATLFEKAANLGNAIAANELGKLYRSGSGVAQDYQKALQWFEKAANGGNGDAACTIGYFYFKGLGVEIDDKKNFYWTKKAAELGDGMGMSNLGLCYYVARGTPRDYEAAKYWWKKAAELGIQTAKDDLWNHFGIRA